MTSSVVSHPALGMRLGPNDSLAKLRGATLVRPWLATGRSAGGTPRLPAATVTSAVPAFTGGGLRLFSPPQLRRTVLPISCGCQEGNTTYCYFTTQITNQKVNVLSIPKKGFGLRITAGRPQSPAHSRLANGWDSFSSARGKLCSFTTSFSTLAPHLAAFNAYS
jgi:hypothetical protein